MPIFKPINENEASYKVKKVFEDIKSSRKIEEVPNFWKRTQQGGVGGWKTLEKPFTKI